MKKKYLAIPLALLGCAANRNNEVYVASEHVDSFGTANQHLAVINPHVIKIPELSREVIDIPSLEARIKDSHTRINLKGSITAGQIIVNGQASYAYSIVFYYDGDATGNITKGDKIVGRVPLEPGLKWASENKISTSFDYGR